MKDHVDSAFSYLVGIALLLYSNLIEFSDEIMTLGGVILLLARLYVDGGKAIQTWRDKRGSKGK